MGSSCIFSGEPFLAFQANSLWYCISKNYFILACCYYSSSTSNLPPDIISDNVLGLEISNITPDLALEFDIDENVGKVVITEVETNGPSFNKGINLGNVIRRAGRQDVNNVNDVLKALNIAKERGSQAFLLLITDGERERFVAINISKLK